MGWCEHERWFNWFASFLAASGEFNLSRKEVSVWYFFPVWLSVHHFVRESYSKNKKVEFIRQLDPISFICFICSHLLLWDHWDTFNWPTTNKKVTPGFGAQTWKERVFLFTCQYLLNWNCPIYKTGLKQHMFTSCLLKNVCLFCILPSIYFHSFYFSKERNKKKCFKHHTTTESFLRPCFLIFIIFFFQIPAVGKLHTEYFYQGCPWFTHLQG